MYNKKQKFADMDLSWIGSGHGKPVDQMSVAEVMGNCPSCNGSYKQNGECDQCGDAVSPQQIARRRQWLKDHPGEEN